MVGNCPVCGAPWNGQKCEYCGYEPLVYAPKNEYAEPGQVPKYGYKEPQQKNYGYTEPQRVPKYSYEEPQQTKYSYSDMQRPEDRSGDFPEMNQLQDADVSPKSRLAALLLCVFLGVFGGHRFYAGKIGTGVLYLLSYGLFGFGWIWDLVMIILGNFRDKNGLKLSRW